MGRQAKYSNEENRKAAIRDSKTKYMVNKEWICSVCENRNYTLAGKWSHLKTKKHVKNAQQVVN